MSIVVAALLTAATAAATWDWPLTAKFMAC